MALLDRNLRSSFALAEAGAANDQTDLVVTSTSVLDSAYKLLVQARDQDNIVAPDSKAVKSPDLLVLGAEAAIKNKDFKTAHEAVRKFFLQAPPHDQFYCRALYIQALIEAENAKPLNGSEAVYQLQKAIGYVLEALEIAILPDNSPRYNFLVYNASVHYWHVARPLLRTGAYQYAVESMSKIVAALEGIDDADTMWRVRYLISLAQGFDEASEFDEAAKQVTKAR